MLGQRVTDSQGRIVDPDILDFVSDDHFDPDRYVDHLQETIADMSHEEQVEELLASVAHLVERRRRVHYGMLADLRRLRRLSLWAVALMGALVLVLSLTAVRVHRSAMVDAYQGGYQDGYVDGHADGYDEGQMP